MKVYDAAIKRRSVRKYKQDPLSEKDLKRMVDAARLAPSEANTQPLKYLMITNPALLPQVYSHLKWAAYLTPEGDPPEGRRPTAYIIVLVDTRVKDSGYQRGLGAAVENMILVGEEKGIASCWIASVDAKSLAAALNIPEYLKIDSVVALGRPDETVVVEPFSDSVKYWRDADEVHHVPKRSLEDVLFINSIKK